MRKAMIGLGLLVCGCLCSACKSTFTVAKIHWKVDSIPEGVWGWDITIPGYVSTSSLDTVQLVDAVGEVLTHIIGMVPGF